MKRSRIAAAISFVLLWTTMSMPGAHADAAGPGPRILRASPVLDAETAPDERISRYSPARPKWGDRLEVAYDPAAPKAVFTPAEEVYAVILTTPGQIRRLVKLRPRGGTFAGEVPVAEGTGYVFVYFTTLERRDPNADLGIMVYAADDRPARGANHQEMVRQFSVESYHELFDAERSLHPDSFAVYRDKWFMESAFKKAEIKAIVEQELPLLEKEAGRGASAGLLQAMSYGYLLLGREEAARRCLVRLAEQYPEDDHTTSAILSYEYQALSNQWKGEGPDAVAALTRDLISDHPGARPIRKLFERHAAAPELSLETAAAVCGAWNRDEPDDPRPHFYHALVLQKQNGDLKTAEAMAGRALDLLLEGRLRLHGDMSGQLTAFLLPGAFSLRAELRRDLGRWADALADIKAAQAVTRETDPRGLIIEGSIWLGLGGLRKAEDCLLQAYEMGARGAEARLREIHVRRHGSDAGFADRLSAVLAERATPESKGSAKGPAAAASPAAVPAADFEVTALDGTGLRLSDLRGKVVVLNFWFIGCAPCRVEMPGLSTLVDEFAGKDVVFIGFASDPAAELRAFLEDHPFKYRIVPDASKVAALYGVSAFPTHVLIGKDGRIAYSLTGGSPDRHEQLRPLIELLLR